MRNVGKHTLVMMIEPLKIPEDCKEMTEKYAGECAGICGQACLAVITKEKIQDVLEKWNEKGLEWRGWSGWNQLREYLKSEGYEVKQVNGEYALDSSSFYICRVQFIGIQEKKGKPYYGWGHWSQASAHTHFIVETENMFFCNEDGIFPQIELPDYLKHYNAVVTSRMRVVKANKNGICNIKKIQD